MAYPHRIVLFAHPRSGSTSLYWSLNAHPELFLSREPFHPKYHRWYPDEKDYSDLIRDVPSLKDALEELFCKYNGMKALDYQLPREAYDYLLQVPQYKLIFLRRENMLQAIVSGLIAAQTHVWQKSNMTNEARKRFHRLQPLSLEVVEEKIAYHKEKISYYGDLIRQRPVGTFIEVTYDGLYGSDMNRNLWELRRIFDFLELEMPSREKLIPYIHPGHAKINGAETYRLVPNIDDIDRTFGSTDNGYIFSPDAPGSCGL